MLSKSISPLSLSLSLSLQFSPPSAYATPYPPGDQPRCLPCVNETGTTCGWSWPARLSASGNSATLDPQSASTSQCHSYRAAVYVVSFLPRKIPARRRARRAGSSSTTTTAAMRVGCGCIVVARDRSRAERRDAASGNDCEGCRHSESCHGEMLTQRSQAQWVNHIWQQSVKNVSILSRKEATARPRVRKKTAFVDEKCVINDDLWLAAINNDIGQRFLLEANAQIALIDVGCKRKVKVLPVSSFLIIYVNLMIQMKLIIIVIVITYVSCTMYKICTMYKVCTVYKIRAKFVLRYVTQI